MYSLWRWVQLAYGSPSKPSIQEHTGWWFCVVHLALNPQDPIHGSWHCWAIQARFEGHSWWITHSGRQFGGAPSIPNAHEQTARPSNTWHSELGPHVPNKHGFTALGGSTAVIVLLNNYNLVKWIFLIPDISQTKLGRLFCRLWFYFRWNIDIWIRVNVNIFIRIKNMYLRLGKHCSNGSPKYPFGHVHIGLCCITRHSAPSPQVPSHGFLHFWLMQASCWWHSLLVTHSGRQFGGWPMNPAWQEHVGRSPITLQMLWLPHGLGSHKLCGDSANKWKKSEPLFKLLLISQNKAKDNSKSVTYVLLEFLYSRWMDHLDSSFRKCTLAHDWRRCIVQMDRTHLDMDLCNAVVYMPFHWHNLSWKHTLADIQLRKHLQYMVECSYIWQYHCPKYILNFHYMAMDSMDQ